MCLYSINSMNKTPTAYDTSNGPEGLSGFRAAKITRAASSSSLIAKPPPKAHQNARCETPWAFSIQTVPIVEPSQAAQVPTSAPESDVSFQPKPACRAANAAASIALLAAPDLA